METHRRPQGATLHGLAPVTRNLVRNAGWTRHCGGWLPTSSPNRIAKDWNESVPHPRSSEDGAPVTMGHPFDSTSPSLKRWGTRRSPLMDSPPVAPDRKNHALALVARNAGSGRWQNRSIPNRRRRFSFCRERRGSFRRRSGPSRRPCRGVWSGSGRPDPWEWRWRSPIGLLRRG